MARWEIDGTTDSGDPATIAVSTNDRGVTIEVEPPGRVTVAPKHVDRLRAAIGHARDAHGEERP